MIDLIFFIYFLIGIKFLYPFFYRYLGLPELPSLSFQISIFALFIIIYLKTFVVNKGFAISGSKLKSYKFVFLSFIVLIFFSALINSNNLLLVVKSILEYSIIYLLLFLALLEMNMKEKEQENILKFIYTLIFIQVPVVICQYLFFAYSTADSNSGTIGSGKLGGTGIVAILMTFLMAFVVAQIMMKGFTVKRLLLALSTFIPPLAGGARIGLILLPLTILLTVLSYFILNKNITPKKFFRGVAITSAFLIVMLVTVFVIIPNSKYARFLDLTTMSSMSNIKNYDKEDVRYNRMLIYTILYNQIYKNQFNNVVGMGNQAIAQSSMADIKNSKWDFIDNYPDSVVFMASLGVLGLSIIILILLMSAFILKSYIQIEPSGFMSAVAYSVIPISVNFIISLFYTSAWATQIGMIYWIILAVLLQRYYVLNKGLELARSFVNTPSKLRLIKNESY